MLKKLTALTAALTTAATMAMAEENDIKRSDVNAEPGSADMCLLDSIGNYSGGATAVVPVTSVATCFDLARNLSNNVPQRDGWRKTQANAMNKGKIVDTLSCRQRSRPQNASQSNCFRLR